MKIRCQLQCGANPNSAFFVSHVIVWVFLYISAVGELLKVQPKSVVCL